MKMIPFRNTVAFACWLLAFSPVAFVQSLSAPVSKSHQLASTHQPSLISRRNVFQTASAVAASSLIVPAPSQAATAINPIATLSDGTAFPLASFGLQIYNDETAYRLTLLALEVGYRNFFASVLAGNQRGFAKAVKDSGVPREDLFICGSVVSNRASGFKSAYQDTTVGWKRNMEAFAVGGIDYLDQIMLDYPGPDAASIQGQWASFQVMQEKKLTKTLSVSNFSPAQLDYIINPAKSDPNFETKVKPVVNQLPYSVAYHPGESVLENSKRGVLVQAWAPLGKSLGGRFSSLMRGTCAEIGKKYNKSFAQVALRWIVQTGASFTTQSQNKDHFKQDLDIFDFELSEDEMKVLSSLA